MLKSLSPQDTMSFLWIFKAEITTHPTRHYNVIASIIKKIPFQTNTSADTVMLAYYLCFSATMLNEIFLPCFFGTELTSTNDETSTAIYSSNWPDQSAKFKKTMIIFVEYLKRPRIMMSGKIFTLTLFSFLTVNDASPKKDYNFTIIYFGR